MKNIFNKNSTYLINLLFILLSSSIIYSKTDKDDEKNVQYGFGLSVSTNTIYDMCQNYSRYKAIENNSDYSYPGISSKEEDNIRSLNGQYQKAILAYYSLKSLEYGFHFRLLWNVLILETNLNILPSNNMYNNKFNFIVNSMIGLRAPYCVMPYILTGPNMTIAFDYNNYEKQKNGKGRYNAIKSSLGLNIGMNLKAGLDLKFKKFSFGAYYLYTVKNFNEYKYLYNEFSDNKISNKEIAGLILKNQSRFGFEFTIYFNKIKKK